MDLRSSAATRDASGFRPDGVCRVVRRDSVAVPVRRRHRQGGFTGHSNSSRAPMFSQTRARQSREGGVCRAIRCDSNECAYAPTPPPGILQTPKRSSHATEEGRPALKACLYLFGKSGVFLFPRSRNEKARFPPRDADGQRFRCWLCCVLPNLLLGH